MCIPGIKVKHHGEDYLPVVKFSEKTWTKDSDVLYHGDLVELEQGSGSDRSHPFTSLKRMQPTLPNPTNHVTTMAISSRISKPRQASRSLKLQFWVWADPPSLSDASVAA